MEPVASILAAPSTCGYLPDRDWQLRYDLFPDLDAASYMERLRAGWRRFGAVVFRPECAGCRMCESLRVPTDTFEPTESQRRVWKKNQGVVTWRIGTPSSSQEKLDLFVRYHRRKHEVQGWPFDEDHTLETFLGNPFPTEEWCYYLGDRLVGVGYVDALPQGLSAIYFFHDPDEHRRSLGTFNVLAILAAARDRGLPHTYLGYTVEGCRSLEYKRRFRPHEILGAHGWAGSETSAAIDRAATGPVGTGVAPGLVMAERPAEQGDERRGAQQERPGDREATHAPSNQQDLDRPAEGRDTPPADAAPSRDRRDTPWLGGG